MIPTTITPDMPATGHRPMPQGTIWVCADCLHAAVNGEVRDDRPADMPEPWTLDDGADVTPGLTEDAHDCGIDPVERRELDDCGCESREFSSSRCEGCGDAHAGSRHAFTYWA